MLKLAERSQFIGLGVRAMQRSVKRENRSLFKRLGSRSDALLFLTLVIQDDIFTDDPLDIPDSGGGPQLPDLGGAALPALGDGTLIAAFERLLAFLIENQDAIKALVEFFLGLIARKAAEAGN